MFSSSSSSTLGFKWLLILLFFFLVTNTKIIVNTAANKIIPAPNKMSVFIEIDLFFIATLSIVVVIFD